MAGKHNKYIQISSANVVEYRKVVPMQADRQRLPPKPCALTGDPDRVAWKSLILAMKEKWYEKGGED